MSAMLDWFERSAQARIARGLERSARVRLTTARTDDGASPVDLASNDYLGLARDPRPAAAAIAAIERFGTGARASRLVTGTSPPHEECEGELAALMEQPSALVFSSGYTANLAAVTALAGPDTLVVSDEHVHASLIDAVRLTRSPQIRVPHNDTDAVETALARRDQRRAIVVVESIYSVLGDAAPLAALAAVCARHDAVLLVDEAHGVGVAGAGRGGVAEAGLAGAEHVFVTATLSKALGSQGGAVLGPPQLRKHLVNTGRSFIFDTGLAPAAAASAAEACRIIASEPRLVEGIAERAALITGLCGAAPSAGAVQSLPVGEAAVAIRAAEALERRGVLVGCFRPPSVPDGISRLRICADAGVPLPVIEQAATVIAEVAEASAVKESA